MNRTQKRLLWVLDTWGARDPVAALYTWVIVRDRFGPAQWRGQLAAPTGAPGLENFLNQAKSWMGSVTSPAVPVGPIPLGGALALIIEWAKQGTRTWGWEDTGCAKIFPQLFLWMRAALAESGWPADLARAWEKPMQYAYRGGGADYSTTTGAHNFRHRVHVVRGELPGLCDWFAGAHPNIGAYPTLYAAIEAANEWHCALQSSGVTVSSGPVVYRWKDGWTVQELVTFEMFKEEGATLGHCIGESTTYWMQFNSGASRFFSMRTPTGQPWLTFDIGVSGSVIGRSVPARAVVEQIKGCKNRLPGSATQSRDCDPPDPTECARVFDFLLDADWVVGDDFRYCWRAAALARGLPEEVAARNPSDFTAAQLLRPPPEIPKGERAPDLDPRWFEHMTKYQARRRAKSREKRRSSAA